MGRLFSMLRGIAIGAGAMYFFDPNSGKRRRTELRDKCIGLVNQVDDEVERGVRQLVKQAQCALTDTFSGSDTLSDEQVKQRVRSTLARCVSDPEALEVTVRDGTVTLSGPIMSDESENVMNAVLGIRGVRRVEDRFSGERRSASTLSSLRRNFGDGFQAQSLSPSSRMALGLTGCGMLMLGLRRRAPLACLLGTVGLGLMGRGMTNTRQIKQQFKGLLGLREQGRGISFHKSIHINKPVAEVFSFWENLENFPRLLSNVRKVTDLGNGRSHWVVSGPLGVPVEWHAQITQNVRNQIIAWRTEAGASVYHTGMVRFQSAAGGTRVIVELTYEPPAGTLGHAIASLFGADPKSEMDEDLAKAKSYLETGIPASDAAEPTRNPKDVMTAKPGQ